MKKLMMIAAMMLMGIGAFAQNPVGVTTLQPKVGINFANLTGDGNKSKVGLVAGVEAEYGVADNIGITVGAMYSMEGAEGEKVNGEIPKMNLDYIDVPIMAQYYIIPGLAAKAGVQFGFNVRKKLSYDGESMDVDDFFKALGADTKLKTFNMCIPIGVSYEYEHFVFDARYNFGLTENFKNMSKNKTSLFSFTVGYKFDL